MTTMTQAALSTLIAQNALFVVNHSGGKDSQALFITMLKMGIPTAQMLVVHASLGEVEWHGALELAQDQAKAAGVPFAVARAIFKDGTDKTLLGMVERKFRDRPEVPSFPSSDCKTCTSDLKRGPIEKVIRHYMKANGFTQVVNCEGIRASESPARSKLVAFEQRTGKNDGLAAAGRSAWNWLPIFDLQTLDVWCVIRAAGEMPHYAYSNGNHRLSCVFCIMGSKNDIALGAKARPELFAKYSEIENRTGYTAHMSRLTLAQIVAEVEAGTVDLALDIAA